MSRAVVPIRIDKTWVLVDAEVVREFTASAPWLSVPGSTPLMPGVMTWRGRAIPVIDLLRALELGALGPATPRPRVMIVQHPAGLVAVPVDAAREVTNVLSEEVRPQHVTKTPYSLGEVELSQKVLPMVDLDAILRTVNASGGSA